MKGMIGFYNNGNSCYFNTALQALLSCKEFRDCILLSRRHRSKNGLRILDILSDIIYSRETNDVRIYNPLMFKTILGKSNRFFRDRSQQDCHECIIELLDILHESLKFDYRKYDMNLTDNHLVIDNDLEDVIKANKLWRDGFKNNFSCISRLFNGQMVTRLSCRNCKFLRSSFELFNNITLSVPREKKIDIIDCFRNYFKYEVLPSVECDHCGERTLTDKKTTIWRFPRILLIHFNKQLSNRDGVEFSKRLVFRGKVRNIVYNLTCIVNHYGVNPYSGHYNCLTFTEKYGWVCVDDDTIRKSTIPLNSGFVYILVYSLE